MKVFLNKPIYTLTYILFLVLVVSSCASTKKVKKFVYFNNLSDSLKQNAIIQDGEPRILPGDRLTVTVGALDPMSAIPYNQAVSPGVGISANVTSGYLVDVDGSIQLPQLGKFQVAGLFARQIVDTLTGIYTKYVMDPVVNVQLINFKITVLGEVNIPGTKIVSEGKINILEAIGLSGDLIITGRRDNVLVIREKNGKREYGRVDLTSTNIFSSPYFNLQQNDVLYVEMTKSKIEASDQSTLVKNLSVAASVVSLLATILVLIVNLKK